MSGPPERPGPSACRGPACWPFSGLSPTRAYTHRPRRQRMRGSVSRTGCPGQPPGFPYRDRGISRCSAGSCRNAVLPGTWCQMRIWPHSPSSTASPSFPRIRISPGSPASHGSIPSPPQPYWPRQGAGIPLCREPLQIGFVPDPRLLLAGEQGVGLGQDEGVGTALPPGLVGDGQFGSVDPGVDVLPALLGERPLEGPPALVIQERAEGIAQ